MRPPAPGQENTGCPEIRIPMMAARPRGSGRHARDEPELHPEEGLPGATHNLRVACPHTQGTSRQEGLRKVWTDPGDCGGLSMPRRGEETEAESRDRGMERSERRHQEEGKTQAQDPEEPRGCF
ncbi:uncharacterized protein LOC121103958 isoform X2 [Ursus maritimus]|uniref:Uncharacterized protein LOC121103958 isoform X2 n=1 Tax=Ursus maritimus TaxID=29073 RepID=A0A8M1GAF1_URSMA|nr:uncharacterized protein LOC121103958 isoform X2 [Ursus maritimus]